ncbi:MAG: radical SAM protein [bacterium]
MRKVSQSIRIGSKLLKYKLLKNRFPLIVHLLLTNRCNLKCFYCYPQVFSRKIEDIDTETWLKVIDELHKMGTGIVTLLGGEPLLYKGIDRIVDRVKKYGMICELVTNGYFVDRKIDIVKKMDSVCISIDGDETTNDRNRGEGSYKKAVAAIARTTSLGIKTRIKAVITKRNLDSFDYLCNFAKDYGVVLTFTLPSIHTESEDLTLNSQEARDLMKTVKLYKQKGFPIGYTMTSLDFMMKWPYNYYSWVDSSCKNQSEKILPCIRNDLTCYIDADGMVYPCAILWSDFPGKNFLKVGIREAWNNLINKPCYSCGYIGEIEINLVLSLSISNILESARYYLKR